MVARNSWLAAPSRSRGTRLGTEASLAGIHTRLTHSISTVATNSQVSVPTRGIESISPNRRTSPTTRVTRRSSRSARMPPSGPATSAGSSRSSRTAAIAKFCWRYPVASAPAIAVVARKPEPVTEAGQAETQPEPTERPDPQHLRDAAGGPRRRPDGATGSGSTGGTHPPSSPVGHDRSSRAERRRCRAQSSSTDAISDRCPRSRPAALACPRAKTTAGSVAEPRSAIPRRSATAWATSSIASMRVMIGPRRLRTCRPVLPNTSSTASMSTAQPRGPVAHPVPGLQHLLAVGLGDVSRSARCRCRRSSRHRSRSQSPPRAADAAAASSSPAAAAARTAGELDQRVEQPAVARLAERLGEACAGSTVGARRASPPCRRGRRWCRRRGAVG